MKGVFVSAREWSKSMEDFFPANGQIQAGNIPHYVAQCGAAKIKAKLFIKIPRSTLILKRLLQHYPKF